MLIIDEALKNIYKNDGIPASSETAHKVLTLYFSDLDLTITNDRIVGESFSLAESICSDDDLTFGSCEASQLKITVANLEQDLSGHEFVLTQTVNDTYEMPLGKYKVHSCEKQNEQWFRDIIAYDCMKNADIDVAVWYNSMYPTGNETYTLKQFRQSLLTYLGIEYEDETLPNDNMIVPKTIDTTQLSGREVLRQCVELNGAFGQINRYGKFTHKILAETYTDYPQEDYPQEDYPQEEPYEQIYGSMVAQNGIKFEEYTCKPIDKLIIRQEEGDVGCIYGGGTNAYIVQGNFLLYGKSSEELEAIAANIAQNIFNREYRPFTGDLIGLPYLEVGDGVKFNINDTVVSYVLQRTLTGIQALRDELKAEGAEQREQNFGVNNEIIQLKGRATKIKKDVEGVRVEVENLEKSTSTRFEQTDQAISAEAVRAIEAETVLNGKIEVNAESISQEVNRATAAESNLNSKIEQTATSITQEVSATYATKTALSTTNSAVSAEVARAQTAETALDSKITQTAESITQVISATYATKTALNAEQNRAQTAETNLNSKIEQTATSITQEVSATYATKTALSTTNSAVSAEVARAQTAETALDSKITQTAESITQEISAKYTTKDEVIGLLPSETLYPSPTLYPKRSVTSDLTADYNSKFEQTATKIALEVNRATATEGELSSRITATADAIVEEVSRASAQEAAIIGSVTILAGQVVLKVDASGNVAAVELGADPSQGTNIKIKADNIQLEGLVTANGNFKINLDGTIEAVNGKFSGTINGSTINGGTITGTNISGTTIDGGTITGVTISGSSITTIGDYGTVSITNGFIDASFINANEIVSKTLTVDTISMSDGGRQVFITPSGITGIIWDTGVSYSFLTSLNYSNYFTIPQYTNQITAVDTGYGNLNFLGFDNAAGVNWVQANFQPKTTSDIRLKYNMFPLDDIPDELFYSLKPYQFKFKPEANYGDKIHFGLIAQQVESAFEAYGLNPYEYDLIEVVDVRKYTDDGYYVKGETHRLNDKNLFAWMIKIIQNQNKRISTLENTIKNSQNIV